MWAQSVSGTVLDEKGKPLFGVNVIEKGTTNGTTTDFDGKFSLTVSSADAKVVFKFLGYRDKEFAASQSPFNFRMELDEIGLDQVVVTASKRKERLLDAPASVSVISAEKIENTAAMTPVDNLKNVPGVDVMPTGLVSQNVTVRGFNNIFSTSMLTLVDHRIGAVPSLRVNAFQLMPANNADIERIELVRGPGSALYGPNASNGVLHIITKSPINMSDDHNAETTVSMTGGWQSVVNPEFRHAHKISDKFAYKISGGYMQGQDFKYYDPREPNYNQPFYFGTVVDGTRFEVDRERGVQFFDRNFFIRKYNTDGRFDFAFNEDIDLTVNVGMANTSNLELTGLGAAQGDGWMYSYAQARFRWKNLYVNTFMNSSNSNDTYIISQVTQAERDNMDTINFQTLADRSKFYALQIQNSNYIDDKWAFTYGFDGLFTRPNSGGTIYGRYEDDSDINQLGVFGQAEFNVSEKLTLLGALRGDYQTPIKEFMVSPRGAIVYKPSVRHTTRLTFNRAFDAPSALNLAIDLPQLFVPNGITARGLGNPRGFNYRYGQNGVAMFRSPYDGQWYDVNQTSNNYRQFDAIANLISTAVARQVFGSQFLPENVAFVKEAIFRGLTDSNSPINNVDHNVIDFITNQPFDVSTIRDVESVKSTVTQTVELGYKGVIKDKLFLSVDAYYTQINNFVSPLSPVSYRVLLNQQQLESTLSTAIMANLQENLVNDPNNPFYDGFFNNAESIIGNAIAGTQGLSLGTVAPESDLVNSDLVLTYLNLGKVDIAGVDLGFTYLATDNIAVSGAFSFMNKDRIPLEGASNGFVALNAPRYKTALAVDYSDIANTGLGLGINWRWQDAFPANSALYVGDVNAANLIDLNINYRPTFSENTIVSANFYNIANYKFQRFPGTPFIGFYALFRVQHTLNYNIGKKQAKAVEGF
jgi:outer membrane receptor for ferrienterochelin and colicins